jgi:peptidoglycan/xylan/chitin deacetylase (PgdA/CDA1 family)
VFEAGAAPRPRPWRPGLLLWITLGLHVFAAALLVFSFGAWPLALGILVVNHLFLATAGLWPRSQVLGGNLLRLPEPAAARGQIALTFDDGPDPEVTPQVLDCLDRYGAKASFFCIGERARAHPDLVAQIVQRGHTIENHSLSHSYRFACFGSRRQADEIDTAQQLLASLAGTAPRFFRAPAGLRNPFLDPLMARRGLYYISWTRRGYDAVRGEPEAVLARLTRGLGAGDVLLLHDGTPARTASGEPVVLAVLPRLLEICRAKGLSSVTLQDGFGLAPTGSGPR